MTQPPPANDGQQPIVIHSPMTGDADRLAAIERPLPAVRPTDIVGPLLPTAARSATPAAALTRSERVFGLDAFRGLLLLAMNFTFTIPAWGPFPKWMYHTQEPPSRTPRHVDVAGLTWQDLLFAMFVFAMAAAIPIAMNGRLARGKPYSDIVLQTLKRGLLLWLFALLIGHVNPYWTNDYTKRGNVLAIAGLLVCFAFFLQPPSTWKPGLVRAVKYVGWLGVAAVLIGVPLMYGQSFSPVRRDGIMAALAFCAVAGTLVWLFTRANVTARLAIFGVIVGARALAPQVVWFGRIWNANPAPWFYEPWYLELLLLVIPGTIAGDLIWRWMHREADQAGVGWSTGRLLTLAGLGLSVVPVLTVGLYERRYPMATAIVIIALSTAFIAIGRSPGNHSDRLLARVFAWAALWLTVGMLVEPLEGGIHKDPQTLGFLLIMAGTSSAVLGSFLIIFDGLKVGARQLRPLALIGQNALFAYVILMLGILHVLWLSGAGDALTSNWQLATVRSTLLTILAGGLVWLATRKRLLWKA